MVFLEILWTSGPVDHVLAWPEWGPPILPVAQHPSFAKNHWELLMLPDGLEHLRLRKLLKLLDLVSLEEAGPELRREGTPSSFPSGENLVRMHCPKYPKRAAAPPRRGGTNFRTTIVPESGALAGTDTPVSFGLKLHPDKRRLIEFGRRAARSRAARGVGKPETFDFLGFTHICGKTKNGWFWLARITISKRMRARLSEINVSLKQRRR